MSKTGPASGSDPANGAFQILHEIVEAIDLAKIAAALCPAAMIAIWRSYYLNGRFPTIGKDDIGGLALIAACYYLFLQIFGVRINENDFLSHHNTWYLLFMLLVLPAFIGILLGLVEGADVIGNLLRKARLKVPFRQLTAWQTIVRELATWDIVIVHRIDSDPVAGRWAPRSCASLDEDHLDLFLSEYGTLDHTGAYAPMSPQRGFYVRIDQIKALEIVNFPQEVTKCQKKRSFRSRLMNQP